MPKKLTQGQWIEKAKALRPDQFNYDRVVYVNSGSKVEIGCNTCGGWFWQQANSHLQGHGCPKCNVKMRTETRRIKPEDIRQMMLACPHAGNYDYSRSIFIGMKVRAEILCRRCDQYFWQRPNEHIHANQGCPACGKRKSADAGRYTSDKIKQMMLACPHADDYDYSKSIFIGMKVKAEILCRRCDRYFWQRPHNHIWAGQGCPTCAMKKTGDSRRITPNEIMKRILSCPHAGDYDYSNSVFVGMEVKAEILCRKCNRHFWQTPHNHIGQRQGCPTCGRQRIRAALRYTPEEILQRLMASPYAEKHDYSKSVIFGMEEKIEIGCLSCGRYFYQTPEHHLSGQSCPHCKQSRGERLVASVLDSLGVRYRRQHKFDECKHKRRLAFDFYLPDHNICVEYHGRQHYEQNEFFGSEKDFKASQKRDRIKQCFCDRNNIHLEVIPYWYNEQQVKTIVSRLAHVQLTLI